MHVVQIKWLFLDFMLLKDECLTVNIQLMTYTQDIFIYKFLETLNTPTLLTC